MRRAFLTTEFWTLIASLVVNGFGWLDFPMEAWVTLNAWIVGRIAQKAIVKTGS